jgi:hypothetical protein
MRNYFLLSLTTLLFAFNSHAKTVSILVDYTMNKARLETIKEKYPKIISEKSDIRIIYLGKPGYYSGKLNKFEEFKVKCGFDPCLELESFYESNTFGFTCFLREYSKCSTFIDDYNIPSISTLSKTEKKKLKKSDVILLIDFKGIEIKPLPQIIINASNIEIEAGEEIIFNSQFLNSQISDFNSIEWFENGIKVEKGSKEYRTSPEESIIVKCKWYFEDCAIESNVLNITVKKCQNSIPYSLYFEAPEIFDRKEKNQNRVYIYPLNDSYASKVILIKQSCYFNEFKMQVLDKDGNFKSEKIFQINEKSSNDILQVLSIRDKSIYAVDVQELIDKYKEQVIQIKIIPTKISMLERNIPKYEVYFTSCSPYE